MQGSGRKSAHWPSLLASRAVEKELQQELTVRFPADRFPVDYDGSLPDGHSDSLPCFLNLVIIRSRSYSEQFHSMTMFPVLVFA